MVRERITRQDVAQYKQEILEQTVMVNFREAAQILSCSVSTVRTLVRSGEFAKYNRHGANTRCNGDRLLASELRNYVNSIRVNSQDFGR